MAFRLIGIAFSVALEELSLLLKLEFIVMSRVVLSAAALMLISVFDFLPSSNEISLLIDCCFVLYRNIFVLVSIGFVVGTLFLSTSRYYSWRSWVTRYFIENR